MKQHTKACSACPWRKTSAAGWLGASSPEEFVATSEAEHQMPCHLHVDYERDDWEDQVYDAPQCAGRAAHFANRCKLPRNSDLIRVERDPDVFTFPAEFIDHHTI